MEQKRKSTGELEEALSSKMKLSEFLKENQSEFIDADIAGILSGKVKEKNIPKADLARRSGMSEIYLHQILAGRRVPSRDRLIGLCLGMGCTVEETREIMRDCRCAGLYARDRRDAVIIYAFHQKWTLNQLNDVLFEIEEESLI